MRIWVKGVEGKGGLPEKVPQSPKSPCFPNLFMNWERLNYSRQEVWDLGGLGGLGDFVKKN